MLDVGPHISPAGIQLVADFEGFRPRLYNCAAGKCTIGFGHLVHTGPTGSNDAAEAPYRAGISREDAVELLRRDLSIATAALREHVKVRLNQPQIDALASFIFNVGVDAFRRSTLLKHLNAARFTQAAAEFDRWVMAGSKKLQGLVDRRRKERALFERA